MIKGKLTVTMETDVSTHCPSGPDASYVEVIIRTAMQCQKNIYNRDTDHELVAGALAASKMKIVFVPRAPRVFIKAQFDCGARTNCVQYYLADSADKVCDHVKKLNGALTRALFNIIDESELSSPGIQINILP